jgi:hypothetical protein
MKELCGVYIYLDICGIPANLLGILDANAQACDDLPGLQVPSAAAWRCPPGECDPRSRAFGHG